MRRTCAVINRAALGMQTTAQASACRLSKSFYNSKELLGHSVERVHFKLDVRRRAQKHPFHWLLRNRTFRGKYRASEKVASQRADFCCLLYTSPSPRDRQKSRMPS